uniref:Uncharacterized protein n=1 Tax=Oryza rufipogon TaxID=4529 RepID=A0A0E0RG13_ORYRU
MWVPEGVGPTVSERNSKIALEAKSKRVACQGSLKGIQGGKKPGLEILLVRGDVESKCAEVGWVRSLWFRFDGVMNMC